MTDTGAKTDMGAKTGPDPATAECSAEPALPGSNELRYWNANLKVLGLLLSVWFAVSFGAGIVFVDALNQVTLPWSDCPLGFWIAQQGAIYGFCLIVLAYVLLMNRVDAAFGVDEREPPSPNDAPTDTPHPAQARH